MDILRDPKIVIFFPSTILIILPTKVLHTFSSNSYKDAGGENRKRRWIFALDRCETLASLTPLTTFSMSYFKANLLKSTAPNTFLWPLSSGSFQFFSD